MFSHRRTRRACVRSKRRCDLRLPQCGGCKGKNIACSFENNEPFADRQTASSLPSQAAEVSLLPRSSERHRSKTPSISQFTVHKWKELLTSPPSWSATVSSVYEPVMPEDHLLPRHTAEGIPNNLCSGRQNPFHPPSLIFAALSSANTRGVPCYGSWSRDAEQTEDAKLLVLKQKLQGLAIAHQRICSFDHILASVQALMLCSIICLFNANASIRTLGEQHCHIPSIALPFAVMQRICHT